MSLVSPPSRQSTVGGASSVTWTHGLTILVGDIVFLLMNGGGGGANTFTYPTGFNAVPGLSNIDIASGFNTLGVAYKVAGGSEPSSYTVSSNVFDSQTVLGFVLRGRNTSAPVTAVAQTNSTAAGSFPISVSVTGVTAAEGDDIVLLLASSSNGSASGETQTLTGPTGFSDQIAGDGGAAFSPPVAYADFVNNPGGATGTLAATWASSNGTNPLAYCAYVISVESLASSLPVPSQMFIVA